MTFRYRIALLAFAGFALGVRPASAQVPASAEAPAGKPAGALKVIVTCPRCDMAAMKTAVGFVEFVTDEAQSDVAVAISAAADGAGERWTLAVRGLGRFAGRDRTLSFMAPAANLNAMLARYLKLGVAEFAAATPLGSQLDLGFQKAVTASGAPPLKKDQKDPWNYWVFRLGASIDASGEQSASYGSHSFSGSANRVTEQWKFRFSGNRYVNNSSYDLDEETTIDSESSQWDVTGLGVKSLGPRWSAAVLTNASGSTFSNQKLFVKITPGIEFDIFPYAESSKRSLTISYTAGPARYTYRNLTIFDKLDETVLQHTLTTSFGLRQPWGSLGVYGSFLQQLTHLDRNRLTVNGNANVRLIKSLTLNVSGSYSRIRDQFSLEKGSASEEEVLLRLRQLATGYRYSLNFGFGYAFGALSNTTVNPRFGGG